MAETEKKEAPAPDSADVDKTPAAEAVLKQKKVVEDLTKKFDADPSDDLSLALNRERDTLRHLLLVQKGTPKERAAAKANYAGKAALRRAIQPVEE